MNPNEATVEEAEQGGDPYAGAADQLRENSQQNAQIQAYTANENARLQRNRLKKLASFKKNKGGPAEPHLVLSTFVLMLGVAIFFDAISIIMNFIPVLGGIVQDITISPAATLTFSIWLKMHGIPFTKGPRGFFLLLTTVIGFIPVVNALPEWTCFVIGLYLSGTKMSTGMQKSLKKVRGK